MILEEKKIIDVVRLIQLSIELKSYKLTDWLIDKYPDISDLHDLDNSESNYYDELQLILDRFLIPHRNYNYNISNSSYCTNCGDYNCGCGTNCCPACMESPCMCSDTYNF
jgi:hypothetical protein